RSAPPRRRTARRRGCPPSPRPSRPSPRPGDRTPRPGAPPPRCSDRSGRGGSGPGSCWNSCRGSASRERTSRLPATLFYWRLSFKEGLNCSVPREIGQCELRCHREGRLIVVGNEGLLVVDVGDHHRETLPGLLRVSRAPVVPGSKDPEQLSAVVFADK